MGDDVKLNSWQQWAHRFAVACVGLLLFMIVVGAMVTTTRAGDTNPEWSLRFWEWFASWWQADGGRAWEDGHRVIGTVIGFMMPRISRATKQAQEAVEEQATRVGMPFVNQRWLGGMLTNFSTIKKQIRRLRELERGQEEGAFDFYTKKERLMLDREREKLDKYLSGVKDMARLPGAVFVIDSKKERIAVNEANKLGIPVIAIADTNADPDLITVPIAGNDDAIRSVSVISQAIADSIAVMYQGRLVRYGPKSKVLTPPFDDYTQLLLSSVPEMEVGWLERAISSRRMEAGGN